MKLRNASYLAIVLHFARKTISKMTPDSPGRTGRWIAIYPYPQASAIVGSFSSLAEAESFRRRLTEFVKCKIVIECLDSWKGHTAYWKLYSVFDFTGNPTHFPQVADFAEACGQSRETTDPTEANLVLKRWSHR